MTRSMPTDCWYAPAASSEVDRDLLPVRAAGLPVVLYRTGAGDVVALEDRCAHRAYPLSSGALIGDTVHKTSGATYPELWDGPGVVEINYTAGYNAGNEVAQQAAVPAGIKAWLLLTIGTLYANREGIQTGVPGATAALPGRFTDSLLDRFKVY